MFFSRRTFLTRLATATAFAAGAALLPAVPVADAAPEFTKNKGRHDKFNEEAKKGGYDVLFLGDSLTEGWEYDTPHGGEAVWKEYFAPLKAARFGVGGEKTSHLLWRIQNGNLDGAGDPKVIVLLIGTNDNWPTRRNRPNPVRTAQSIRELIAAIQKRKPKAKILLLGLLPAYKDPNGQWRLNNKKTNSLIQKFADNEKVFFLDFSEKLVDDSGKLRGHSGTGNDFYHKDEIHLRTPGYQVFAKAVQPEVKRLLALPH
ncbi:MAG: GDSL-type esterase/lipase family protein [Puniceicoccales bacterium]|jgi:N-acetylglucosamine-6-sulfatase|nr:GDSL-type esterase/lipase family protein [Puniceicoccales bacterium]